MLLAPFNLCSVILAYIAAVVIDATGNYRLIWLFPAATGLAHATVNCWLKYPARKATSPDMVKRLWEWSVVQAESMAETGIVTGLLAAPLLGVVTKEDADSAVVIDMARNILGNPYGTRGRGHAERPRSRRPGAGRDGHAAGDDGQSSAGGGVRGVTGVRQVGGGPEDGRAMGDQKFGMGGTDRRRGRRGRVVGSGRWDRRGRGHGGRGWRPRQPRRTRGVPSGGVASPRPRCRGPRNRRRDRMVRRLTTAPPTTG